MKELFNSTNMKKKKKKNKAFKDHKINISKSFKLLKINFFDLPIKVIYQFRGSMFTVRLTDSHRGKM